MPSVLSKAAYCENIAQYQVLLPFQSLGTIMPLL